jgi:DNA-binding transcriptional LysR family regulator
MKLQQLKYLLAIVDNGLNITAAADRLYTSQPGVSKQLKLLEQELGLQLFTRKGKSLNGVTAAGDLVIKRARLIMQEVDSIRSLTHRFREENHRFGTKANHAPVHSKLAGPAASHPNLPRRNFEQV